MTTNDSKREQVIFSLWDTVTGITTYRLIATNNEVTEQICNRFGGNMVQNIFTKEQAINLAKCILKKYEE